VPLEADFRRKAKKKIQQHDGTKKKKGREFRSVANVYRGAGCRANPAICNDSAREFRRRGGRQYLRERKEGGLNEASWRSRRLKRGHLRRKSIFAEHEGRSESKYNTGLFPI